MISALTTATLQCIAGLYKYNRKDHYYSLIKLKIQYVKLFSIINSIDIKNIYLYIYPLFFFSPSKAVLKKNNRWKKQNDLCCSVGTESMHCSIIVY